MKFRRGSRARRVILVRDTVDRLRDAIRINRWRAASRSRRRIVAKHRVITGIRSSPNLRSLLCAFALFGSKASVLRRGSRSQQDRRHKNQRSGDPITKLFWVHCLTLRLYCSMLAVNKIAFVRNFPKRIDWRSYERQ